MKSGNPGVLPAASGRIVDLPGSAVIRDRVQNWINAYTVCIKPAGEPVPVGFIPVNVQPEQRLPYSTSDATTLTFPEDKDTITHSVKPVACLGSPLVIAGKHQHFYASPPSASQRSGTVMPLLYSSVSITVNSLFSNNTSAGPRQTAMP